MDETRSFGVNLDQTMRDPSSSTEPHRAPPSSELHVKLEGLKVTIVTPRDEAGEFLTRELQRLRVTTRNVLPSVEPLPVDSDVIYCDYDPGLPRRAAWLTGDGQSALVVILPQAETISADALAAMTPQAVLARPFTANAILASLVVARAQSRYEQRLRGKVERLEENLRSTRTVERAKAMLMSSRGMSDEEAYKHIRSQAMARRMPVSALAAAIVSSFELLGGDIG